MRNPYTVYEDVVNNRINWWGDEVIDREMTVEERRIKDTYKENMYRTSNLDSAILSESSVGFPN